MPCILLESVLQPYIPAGVFLLAVAATAAAMLLTPYLLGPRRRDPIKSAPYECGAPVLGAVRQRFSVKFYLVAILFVLFDIEAVFLIPWAVGCRSLGIFAAVEMLVFVGILAIGLLYVWKRGGLEWD